MIIDCPIVSSSWTPAAPTLDLSNTTPATVPTTTALSWAERAEHAAEVLAKAERDELVAAFQERFAY